MEPFRGNPILIIKALWVGFGELRDQGLEGLRVQAGVFKKV